MTSLLQSTPSRTPVAAPLIVIGLPRSGSSYLAHVLSRLDGLWVFDDLYAYQKAAAITFGPMSDDQLRAFMDRLAWETRARIIWERDFGLPALSRAEVDALERSMIDEWLGRAPTWAQLTEEWMVALAAANGAHRWGYKTPQDFMNIEALLEHWPAASFLHLVRDPRAVLKSYKNLVAGKGTDGDPRSYHPVVTALYWKTAQEKVRQARLESNAPVTIIRFEDLVATPEATAQQLASELGTTVVEDVTVRSFNSTGSGDGRASGGAPGSSRPSALTPTEIWLCERVVGDELAAAGYEPSGARPRLRDLPHLVRISAAFAGFQIQRSIQDPEKRQSVVRFARRALQR